MVLVFNEVINRISPERHSIHSPTSSSDDAEAEDLNEDNSEALQYKTHDTRYQEISMPSWARN